jgi:hypothetical protein
MMTPVKHTSRPPVRVWTGQRRKFRRAAASFAGSLAAVRMQTAKIESISLCIAASPIEARYCEFGAVSDLDEQARAFMV